MYLSVKHNQSKEDRKTADDRQGDGHIHACDYGRSVITFCPSGRRELHLFTLLELVISLRTHSLMKKQ